MRVTILGLGTQIPEIPAQRKFVSVECHAHKPPKTVAPTVNKIIINKKYVCV